MISTIGQRLLVGFPQTSVTDELRGLIRRGDISSFVLFSHNIESPAQLMQLTRELSRAALDETGRSAIIAIDQEGGGVQRMPKGLLDTPWARELGDKGADAAYEAGRATGERLREYGITWDLAPVMDVEAAGVAGSAIGRRSFSGDPSTVASCGIRFMDGLHDSRVMSCLKHFPGHGGIPLDTHNALPRVTKSLEDMRADAFVPFRRGIEAGAMAVMTCHAIFENIDADRPASLSRRVTSLLRDTMDFDGIIITDCMEMGAIVRFCGAERGAMLALDSGADMVTLSHDTESACRIAESEYARERVADIDISDSTALSRIERARAWLCS